jgi:hypothetical protein
VSADGLHAEQRARVRIDAQLAAAGWHVRDMNQLDLINHPHSAVREVIMKSGSGRADYLLYVDRTIGGVIEAKPEGTPLSDVEWQSAMYATGLSAPQQLRAVTTNIAHLSAKRFKTVEFAVPTLGEQRRLLVLITDRLSAVSRLTSDAETARLRSGVLRRPLLHAAFTGRLAGRASDLDRAEELMSV